MAKVIKKSSVYELSKVTKAGMFCNQQTKIFAKSLDKVNKEGKEQDASK